MVSFTDHYNAICVDRLSLKTEIGKDSLYFNNSSFMYARVLLSYKGFLFFVKTQNTATLQQVAGGNTPNLVLKRTPIYFLKIPPQENITILRLKIRLQNCKKENFNQEIKPMIENL